MAMQIVSDTENLRVETDGHKLVVTVKDISKDYGPSGSGKTNVVASTNGFLRDIPGTNGLMLMVNANRKSQ